MKVTGPGFSFDASGSIGGTLVYSKWKGRNYVRTLVTPSNPRSTGQTAQRAMLAFLSQTWAALTTGQQATWNEEADALTISPFNAYVRSNLRRWSID